MCAWIWRPGVSGDASALTSPPGVAAPTGGADLIVGDFVGQQRVDLGGFSAGVAESAAHGFDGDPAVDQLGGVGVAELVDADPGAGGGAVLRPPVVRRVIGQRAALYG